MAVISITRNFNPGPQVVNMTVDDDLADVVVTGYLVDPDILASIELVNSGPWEWLPDDMVLVGAADGDGWFTLSSDLESLELYSTAGNGAVTLPVGAGNLPMFDGTLGAMEDSGIAAADVMTNALNSAQIWVGNASNEAAAVTMSGDATLSNAGALTIANNAVTTAKILNANVTLAKLASGIAPSHVVKFAGQPTTVGGAAAEAITVTGALNTDLAFCQMVDDGTNNVTIVNAVVTADTLTVTFSADPGNDCVINYQLLRAAS